MSATKTRILQLQKPDASDKYDLSLWNGNTDQLEAILAPIKLSHDKYNIVRVNKVGDYWTEVQYRRLDGTIYIRSVLDTLVNGLYTTLTIYTYDIDGLTAIDRMIYTLSYDGDRKPTNIILT